MASILQDGQSTAEYLWHTMTSHGPSNEISADNSATHVLLAAAIKIVALLIYMLATSVCIWSTASRSQPGAWIRILVAAPIVVGHFTLPGALMHPRTPGDALLVTPVAGVLSLAAFKVPSKCDTVVSCRYASVKSLALAVFAVARQEQPIRHYKPKPVPCGLVSLFHASTSGRWIGMARGQAHGMEERTSDSCQKKRNVTLLPWFMAVEDSWRSEL
jgi:hypothetical protein